MDCLWTFAQCQKTRTGWKTGHCFRRLFTTATSIKDTSSKSFLYQNLLAPIIAYIEGMIIIKPYDSLPLTTLRELTMMKLIDEFTDLPQWTEKVSLCYIPLSCLDFILRD
jgi:hypothetical protein